ncbi:hypothetical protein BJX63DRAFT_382397 [Aspergillus granulosus]|uniref:Uncharacterized protein n=1 Tax=Aspergillus granulosus TaxID=176169 RepID=A0ABR4HUE9_9EURO
MGRAASSGMMDPFFFGYSVTDVIDPYSYHDKSSFAHAIDPFTTDDMFTWWWHQ